jgi:fibro-slime domain-containing protein
MTAVPLACSSDASKSKVSDGNEGGAPGSGSTPGAGGSLLDPGGDGGRGGASGKPVEIVTSLPPGFTASASRDGEEAPRGGYKVVGALADADLPGNEGCANILTAVTRDLTDAHVDFGAEKGDGPNFVLSTLGSDRKPVLNQERVGVSDIQGFDDWYRNVEGVNQPFLVELWLEPVDGTFIFSSGLYFPLDGVGFPETHADHDGNQRNFLFTTELHTAFKYKGGEQFLFRGDDDVWVFINKKLAVDLGGVHGVQEGSVSLDAAAEELGIEVGKTYALDLFHAERKPKGSNFRIETTLDFTGCGEVLPGDVVR